MTTGQWVATYRQKETIMDWSVHNVFDARNKEVRTKSCDGFQHRHLVTLDERGWNVVQNSNNRYILIQERLSIVEMAGWLNDNRAEII